MEYNSDEYKTAMEHARLSPLFNVDLLIQKHGEANNEATLLANKIAEMISEFNRKNKPYALINLMDAFVPYEQHKTHPTIKLKLHLITKCSDKIV